jgi:hypothetical protein
MKQIDLTNNNKSRKTPFKVPEGYFENFATEMMKQIPETTVTATPQKAIEVEMSEPKVTIFTRIKPYIYLAATICGLAFGIKIYQSQKQYYAEKNQTPVTAVSEDQASKYVDDACDFMMIDDHDVYACATNTF